MSKLELILTLMDNYKQLAKDHEEIIKNNAKYRKRRKVAKREFPRKKDETEWEWERRIEDYIDLSSWKRRNKMIHRENYYLLLAAIIKKAVEDYNIEIDPNWKEPKKKFKRKCKRSAEIYLTGKRCERFCELAGISLNYIKKRAGVK